MAINTEVPLAFGHAIARGDYEGAHSLLTKEAQRLHPPETLKHAVEEMIAIGDGSIRQVELMEECTLENWRDKWNGDVGYVYVALTGDSFCEAVTVTLTTEDGQVRIRELEWGRP